MKTEKDIKRRIEQLNAGIRLLEETREEFKKYDNVGIYINKICIEILEWVLNE